MRVLFRKGQLGTGSSVSMDLDHVGIVKAETASKDADAELAVSTELPIGVDATQWVSAAAFEIARIRC